MLNPQDRAEADIRRLAGDSVNVMMTNHAADRLLERGYTMAQVIKCLVSGQVIEGPVLDSEKGTGWKCIMEVLAAGEWIRVICKLMETKPGSIIVITVI